jgi:PAS domain-containing protein
MSSDFPAHAAFTFLNQSRDVFVIADAGGALRYVSPSAANLFGFKNADILGKPATLFIHPGTPSGTCGVGGARLRCCVSRALRLTRRAAQMITRRLARCAPTRWRM